MSDRVVVFVDYQNVYRRARDAFFMHDLDPHWCGQIDPLKLGRLLVDRSPYDRRLVEVRVYRGMPVNDRDPKGYAAARRQLASWSSAPEVNLISRPIRYPKGWPAVRNGERPGEKGIDVALAIDYAAMAVRGEFDVGILFSVDTDLKPALEFVSSTEISARSEVAAWAPDSEDRRRLSLGRGKPFCHWLDAKDFHQIKDDRDYTI